MANNLKTRINNAFAAMGKQEKVILSLTVEAIDHAEQHSNAPDMLRHLLDVCHNESDRTDILTIVTAFSPFALNGEKVLAVSKAKAKAASAYSVDRLAVEAAKSFRSLAKELRGESEKEKAAFDLMKEIAKLIKKAEKAEVDASQLAPLKALAGIPEIIEAEAGENVTPLSLPKILA